MKKAGSAPQDKSARAMLEKHGCPVPFHEVRTRFLGNIATPALSASPLQTIKGLWGGELPVFGSADELDDFLKALLHGLWNDLARHQKRSEPFRLTRMPMESTAAGLGRYGRVRLEELDGFLEGLFGGEEAIDLPERAHHAVGYLAELRAIMAGICDLTFDDPEAGGEDRTQLDSIFKSLREMTRIMETEIHEAVLSCTRARRLMLEGLATRRPTLH